MVVRNQSGSINSNTNHSYPDFILYRSSCRDWWRISYLVMDKEKEDDNSWFSWWSNFIYLWYSSNAPTIKLW